MNVENELERCIAMFSLDLKVSGKRAPTVTHYTTGTLRFAKWWEEHQGKPFAPKAVTKTDVKLWVVYLRDTYKPSTVRNFFVGFRSFCKWAVGEGVMKSDPTVGIATPEMPTTEKQIVGPEDILTVLKMLERKKNWRDASIIAMLFESGIRSRELCTMLNRQVDWEKEAIHLEFTKSGQPRVTMLGPQTQRYLLRLGQQSKPKEDPVFISRTGKMLNRSTLYDIVHKHFGAAGLDAHPHLMRHSAASALALAGMDSKDLDEVFGWDDPRTSKVYTRQVSKQRALNAQRKLSPLSTKGFL